MSNEDDPPPKQALIVDNVDVRGVDGAVFDIRGPSGPIIVTNSRFSAVDGAVFSVGARPAKPPEPTAPKNNEPSNLLEFKRSGRVE